MKDKYKHQYLYINIQIFFYINPFTKQCLNLTFISKLIIYSILLICKGYFMIETHFSLNLKKLRKDYNLTQEELGNIFGITKVQISYYERGISYPKLDFVIQIAQYFNIPLSQLVEPSIRSNFYFREATSQENISITLPTMNGTENLVGVSGFISIPSNIKTRINTSLDPKIIKYANFMLLIPNGSSELTTFFYQQLDRLPEQPLENLFSYNYWCIPSSQTEFYDGYPLLYQLLWTCNKGAWMHSPIAKPATDDNILAIVLPQNDEIIRLFILPEKDGCKLHASRSPELQSEIELWLQKEKKERQMLAREYCLQVMQEETTYEDMIEQYATDSTDYDEKYNLKKFLKNRGIKLDVD